MTLDMLPLGQEAVITSVGGTGVLRCRLLDMGLIPKTCLLYTSSPGGKSLSPAVPAAPGKPVPSPRASDRSGQYR